MNAIRVKPISYEGHKHVRGGDNMLILHADYLQFQCNETAMEEDEKMGIDTEVVYNIDCAFERNGISYITRYWSNSQDVWMIEVVNGTNYLAVPFKDEAEANRVYKELIVWKYEGLK